MTEATTDMGASDEHQVQILLRRWTDAGLLDEGRANAIVDFERSRGRGGAAESDGMPAPPGVRPPPPPPPPSAVDAAGGQPRGVHAAEAIGYVGAALAVGAVIMLLADTWFELRHGAQLALVGAVTILLGAAMATLSGDGRPALQRLVSVLGAGMVAGVAAFAGLFASVDLDLSYEAAMTVTGGAAAVVAVGIYAWRSRALAQAVTLFWFVWLALSALSLPSLQPEGAWYGLLMWGIGVSWMLAGHGGWIRPRWVAGVLGGAVALLGAQVGAFTLGFSDLGSTALLALGVATAAAAVGVAVTADTHHHLVIGAVGLFVLVPQLAFELFGEAIGAPATLLVVGLLLVVLAVGIGRVRREVTPSNAGERS